MGVQTRLPRSTHIFPRCFIPESYFVAVIQDWIYFNAIFRSGQCKTFNFNKPMFYAFLTQSSLWQRNGWLSGQNLGVLRFILNLWSMKTMSFSSNIAWSQGLSEWQLISIFSRHFPVRVRSSEILSFLTNCYTKKSSWEAPEFHTGYFLKGRIGEDNAKYKDWSATLFLYSVLVQLMVKSTLYK